MLSILISSVGTELASDYVLTYTLLKYEQSDSGMMWIDDLLIIFFLSQVSQFTLELLFPKCISIGLWHTINLPAFLQKNKHT